MRRECPDCGLPVIHVQDIEGNNSFECTYDECGWTCEVDW